jgi:hypothetical protein
MKLPQYATMEEDILQQQAFIYHTTEILNNKEKIYLKKYENI